MAFGSLFLLSQNRWIYFPNNKFIFEKIEKKNRFKKKNTYEAHNFQIKKIKTQIIVEE